MGLRAAETREQADRRRWAEADRLEAARRAELGVGVPREAMVNPGIVELTNLTIRDSGPATLTTYAHRGGFELAWGGVR